VEELAFGEKLEYEATDCPDVDGGRPGVSEGDFGSAEYRWLRKMLSYGVLDGSGRLCVSSVSVSKRQDVLTFAVIHQSHRDILNRSIKAEIR
jgi:hypothetical protein